MIDDFLPSETTKTKMPTSEASEDVGLTVVPEESIDEKIQESEAAIQTAPITNDGNLEMSAKAGKTSKNNDKWYVYHWPFGKKEWATAIIVVLLLIIAGFILLHSSKPNSTTNVPKLKVAVKLPPKTVASRLTGVQIDPASAALPVTAVMIENSDAARPQSGLSSAGIIYEAVAEGGVTRFMALYEDSQPTSIGPIRSARPFYIDALLPYDAAYAHVGGSPDALSDIPALNVKDMNQFYNGNSYTRITSRAAPHNVYTGIPTLISLEKSKGWTTSNFQGLPRKVDAPAKTPTAATIDLALSGPDYNPHYVYNPKLNNYARSEGGAPMIDANTNQQLAPKVVIALVIPWSYGALDATGAYYTDYADVGSGIAYVFQDGIVTTGTWSKTSRSGQLSINDASGAPIKLNAGQTWITAVGKSSNVTYAP